MQTPHSRSSRAQGQVARRAVTLIALLLAAGLPASLAASYRIARTIDVGGEGGWDYLSVDAATHRLYAAHATHLVVIDTRSDRVVGRIDDTPGVHGIAIDAAQGRGFSSNGRENTIGVVDLKTLHVTNRIPAGRNPDCIQFSPATNEVYAFNGHSNSATVVDATTGKVVTTMPLPGRPEFAVPDPVSPDLYLNLEDKSEVARIDGRDHRVVSVWPLAPGEHPSGLAFDAVHRRLFSGCENAQVEVLDADTGRLVATIPAGRGIDAVGFDPGTGLVFASNGRDGTLTIAHEDSPDRYTVVQTLKTELGARTLAVDTDSHKVYLATASFRGGKPGWRNIEPGTFHILVAELSP